jgi:ubiquinone/menaquinone biosynthesis C-methylase UbiE
MLEQSQFNTDSRALEQRIQAHEKFGSKDLNAWIFETVRVQDGLSVLDLGCGVGKQTIPLAEAVGRLGQVLAVDLSQRALDVLYQKASAQSLGERVKVLCCGFDDLEDFLNEPNQFDLVMSCFSLYYANEPEKVFRTVHRSLKPGCAFFFCGPANDNNLELKHFHWTLKTGRTPLATEASVFMEMTGSELAGRIFRETKVLRFQNELRFDSPESLCSYWSSYNLYDPNLEAAFKVAAEEHFRKSPFFATTKRVCGVRSIK